MRPFVLTAMLLSAPALAGPSATPYVPAPADQIPLYSAQKLPCEVIHGIKTNMERYIEKRPASAKGPNIGNYVVCEDVDNPDEPNLDAKPLRELSLMRNTIFARYGWAGFRKTWLREYFQKQPWYKPDESFTDARLSAVDRENVSLITKAELSLRMVDLEDRRDAILARAGKQWGDAPRGKGKRAQRSCELETASKSKDCRYHEEVLPQAPPDLSKLAPEDNIELGLLSRAMGDFAVDKAQRSQLATSLDTVLSVADLRQLSLRDLRLLRNTIFARRGRPFKSELLQEHFARMPWYKPDTKYSDARLTKTDQLNISLIQQVEGEFGGALGDQDFQIDNPSKAKDKYIEAA